MPLPARRLKYDISPNNIDALAKPYTHLRNRYVLYFMVISTDQA
ncbi:hypothetical protein EMIT0P74_80283 [Pseudomonas sp. IT-P74]